MRHGWIPAAGLGIALLLTSGAAGAAGEPTTLRGELDVLVADDFARGRSELRFFLRDEGRGRPVELQFHSPPAELRSGQRVEVRGRWAAEVLEVDALETEGGAGAGGETAAVVPSESRAVVVLMVDLLDARASDRYTLEQIAAGLWTGGRSVDGLLQDASWEQLELPADTDGDGAPDAFGPFAIPYSASTCDYYGWASAADAAASAAGIDLSLYRHRVYALPRYNDIACSWAGLANVGCGSYCRAWIAENESPMVFAHELGHNLGMGHASTDPENDGIENSEYGDLSDPMGISRAWHVFNAAHADQMRWFDAYPGTLLQVGDTGSFDLRPLGVNPLVTGGLRALRVPKPDSNEFYFLSFRRPVGYDDSLSSTYTRGVSIHRYPGAGSAHTRHVVTLGDGEQFQDPANGLVVTQRGMAPDASYVSVELSYGCVVATPQVGLGPSSQAAPPGGTLPYTVTVTNRDSAGCEPSTFDLVSSLPSGFSQVLADPALTLAPGASDSTSLTLQVGASEGTHPFQVSAVGAEASGSGSAQAVVDATAPTPPTLSASVKRKSQVALSWSGASDLGAGIVAYRVHREGPDGALEWETAGTSDTDRSTASGATYTYTVRALDGVGLVSVPSNAVTLTLGEGGTGGGAGKGGGGSGGGKGGGSGKGKK